MERRGVAIVHPAPRRLGEAWRRRGGVDDIIITENGIFRGITPNNPIDILLGICSPIIIHDLQNARTY